MDLWRISKFHSLSGEGGRLYPARWNTAGLPIVYLAASAAGALVEVLVHLEVADDPPPYTLLRVTVPDSLAVATLAVPRRAEWKFDVHLTRRLGDAWLRSRQSALARVPSAILPHTENYLLNPLHPDAARIRITSSTKAAFDSRLLHPAQSE